MNSNSGRVAFFAVVTMITLLSGMLAWQNARPPPLPAGFVVGSGRLESAEIDITTRTAGRVKEILVRSGERVEPGQIVARMDTQALEFELQQLQARVKQAGSSVALGIAVAPQKPESRSSVLAVLAQRRPGKVAAMPPIEAAQAPELPPPARSLESPVTDPESPIEVAIAAAEKIRADIDDATLRTPRGGRVQSGATEPGELLPAGGKLLTVVDPADVAMTFFLPESSAGKVALGSEVRLVLDAVPQYVIPARVASVEGGPQLSVQRQRLAFRSKAQIDPVLLRKYKEQLKAGLPGVAYVRLESAAQWPEYLQLKLPQ
jgi:HlyD family secretion protein